MFSRLKFKYRPRNRRNVEREYVLDVKLETSQTRAARMRIAGVVLSVIFILTVAGLVCWRVTVWTLDRLIYKNDAFAIRQIDIQTDGVISPATLREWAMVKTGENLFALDLMRVKRDLELQPPIQFVAVERVLPRTLKLRVSEREPIAQSVVLQPRRGGGFEQAVYDFDEAGFVMKPLDPRWRALPPLPGEKLPILSGVAPNEMQPGRPVDSPQIRGALQLLSEFDHSPMFGLVELQRIDVTTPEILQVTTSQGAEITFSLNQFDGQLRRWRQIYDQYQKWGKAIASLDLSISNNLPVRWVAAVLAPPVNPKAIKPSRTRRKNV